jgi:hypothetical protein
MDLSKEETEKIKSRCLFELNKIGTVPDDNLLFIYSGSLGIKKLGCVDFLSQCGYQIVWRHGYDNKRRRTT